MPSTLAKVLAISNPGACLPLSYWLILAEAENSSIPARTPSSIWEIFKRSRALLSRLARRELSLEVLTIPKIILVFSGYYTKTSLVLNNGEHQ